MSKLSLLDKLMILLEVSKSSFWSIIILVLLIGLGVVFFTTNKKNATRNKKIYLVFVLFVVSLMLVLYYQSLANMFDYMMNNFFIAVYFPNLAIYFAAIIATNIILWISIFNFKTSTIIKRINIVVYILLNYLLVLILGIINTEGLDVFTQESIYKNKQATALIELSSLVFAIWIIYLIIYKIIYTYIKKDTKNIMKQVVVTKENKKLPKNYKPTKIPSYIYGNAPVMKTVKNTLSSLDTLVIENQRDIDKELAEIDKEYQEIEKKKKQIAYEKAMAKEFDDLLTIDDYKMVLKILKGQKNNSQNKINYQTTNNLKTNNAVIEAQRKEIKRLEEEKKLAKMQEQERLKKMREQEEKRHQENLTELERLFQSIQ